MQPFAVVHSRTLTITHPTASKPPMTSRANSPSRYYRSPF